MRSTQGTATKEQATLRTSTSDPSDPEASVLKTRRHPRVWPGGGRKEKAKIKQQPFHCNKLCSVLFSLHHFQPNARGCVVGCRACAHESILHAGTVRHPSRAGEGGRRMAWNLVSQSSAANEVRMLGKHRPATHSGRERN